MASMGTIFTNDRARRRFAWAIALFILARVQPGLPASEAADAPFRSRSGVRYFTPANQILTPAGIQVDLPGLRPQALALSPNGKILVTAGKTHELIVIDPASGRIRQHIPLPPEKLGASPAPVSEQILEPDKEGQLSF